MYLRLYDSGSYSSGGGWTHIINVPAVDGPQDIIIDLSTATDRNGAEFSTLGDTITKIRMDAIYGKTGSNKIDYIRFTKNHPNPYAIKAYSFGDNFFNPNTCYWIYKNVNDQDGNTQGGWKGDYGLPVMETVDGYENVIKIEPTGSNAEGRIGITHVNGSPDLETYLAGKRTKVSFDYKATGDCVGLRFQNSDNGGNDRDGEEFTVGASNQWQHFEGFIYHDEELDAASGNRRAYLICAIRDDAQGNKDGEVTGALYIKDWQIRILNEEKEVGFLTDGGVAIRVVDSIGKGINDSTKIHVSAYSIYSDEEKVLTGFDSGSVIDPTDESTKYYYLAPTDGATEIRTYIWDDFEALVEPFVLQKAN